MLAEEELRNIFSKAKQPTRTGIIRHTQAPVLLSPP